MGKMTEGAGTEPMTQLSEIREPLLGDGSRSAEPLPVRLRSDIVSGALPAGCRLKTQELARRYGTSVNPVREALHQLNGEGFVVLSRNRGARVRELDEWTAHVKSGSSPHPVCSGCSSHEAQSR